MKLSDDELRRRRSRLQDAIDQKFGGSADKLGQALDYKDGGFLRQMLKDGRTVSEKTIAAIEALPELNGWFAAGPWPFEHVPRHLFESLSEREKGMVEDAMATKIADVISRRELAQPQQKQSTGK